MREAARRHIEEGIVKNTEGRTFWTLVVHPNDWVYGRKDMTALVNLVVKALPRGTPVLSFVHFSNNTGPPHVHLGLWLRKDEEHIVRLVVGTNKGVVRFGELWPGGNSSQWLAYVTRANKTLGPDELPPRGLVGLQWVYGLGTLGLSMAKIREMERKRTLWVAPTLTVGPPLWRFLGWASPRRLSFSFPRAGAPRRPRRRRRPRKGLRPLRQPRRPLPRSENERGLVGGNLGLSLIHSLGRPRGPPPPRRRLRQHTPHFPAQSDPHPCWRCSVASSAYLDAITAVFRV
jgi:hypothetical protein